METIAANGTSIAFKRSGKGLPLLLLHGAEADHSMFDAFAPLLSDDFTVIAYDQRDSGDTKNPATPYGFEELADDAAALIAALGYSSANVFGTSFGGVIAQVLAARHGERIDRLVLSSTFRPGAPLPQVNPEFPRFAELRGRLPDSIGEFAKFFFTARLLRPTSPSAVGVCRRQTQRGAEGAPRRRDPQADLGRSRQDHRADTRSGRRGRSPDPARAHIVTGAGDREREDRNHCGCRPCRHAAEPGGSRCRGEGVPARGKITTTRHGGERPWQREGRISSRFMTGRR